jgi:hypothetical protein
MTADAHPISETQASVLVAELCDLLSAQIACAQDGSFAQVEHLCARADDVVARIGQTGAHHTVTKSQRTRLERLYQELVLMLQAEHADIEARLRQLRQVKRAIGAYGGRAKS